MTKPLFPDMNYQPLEIQHPVEIFKAKKSKKKIIIASVAAAAVLVPGAAWAAVSIFGFGQIDSAAAVTQNLTVDNSSAVLTHSLVPGQTVGARVAVNNPNDFPVKVTSVLLQNNSLTTTGAGCAPASIHPVGSAFQGSYPGVGGGPATQLATDAVTIAPGHSEWVTVAHAVSQDASATAICGVGAKFAVVAETVTGN